MTAVTHNTIGSSLIEKPLRPTIFYVFQLKNFYELLLEYPDWFTTIDPKEKSDVFNRDIRIIPGGCDKEGRIIFISKIGNDFNVI